MPSGVPGMPSREGASPGRISGAGPGNNRRMPDEGEQTA